MDQAKLFANRIISKFVSFLYCGIALTNTSDLVIVSLSSLTLAGFAPDHRSTYMMHSLYLA